MNTTTLTHRRNSVFKNTAHAIGANTTNRTVNLADSADEILADVAKRTGKSISEFIRQALAIGIEQVDHRAAVAFRAAIREHATKAAMLFFALVLPFAPQLQSRRIPRSSTLVRTVAFAVRRQEVTA